MENLIVAMPNGIRLAEMLGKKGSENGLAFYNRRGDTKNIVMLVPHSIEEKYYAVPQSLILSDLVVLDTSSLDAVFGDVVVACSMLGKPVVFTDANPVDRIIDGLCRCLIVTCLPLLCIRTSCTFTVPLLTIPSATSPTPFTGKALSITTFTPWFSPPPAGLKSSMNCSNSLSLFT